MKIQSGEHQASLKDFDWDLHKGHGPRTFKATISFPSAFRVPPTVVVSLTMFDIASGQNARLMTYVHEAEHDKFTIAYRTWNNTWVNEARASWIAYGD